MELLILIVVGLYVWYVHGRLFALERRMSALEQSDHAHASTREETTPPLSSSPLEGERFTQDHSSFVPPAPVPAPAPSPLSFSDEIGSMSQKKEVRTSEESGARWLGIIGAVAIFLGFVFFFKYAVDSGWITETWRVVFGLLFGLTLVGVGERLQGKYLNFSDLVVSSGVGVLYLSIFAGYYFYELFTSMVAFPLMILVTLFGIVLALAGSRVRLALFSFAGGFLTPILLSDGGGDIVVLSTYLLILDVGAFLIALFRKWITLHYLSFFGTFVLFGSFIASQYSDVMFGTAFIFATLFFVVFLAMSLAQHFVRREQSSSGDLALLLLNALVYLGLGVFMIDLHAEHLLGFFAFALAVVHLGLAYVSFVFDANNRYLNLALPGIASIFLAIAIPLQLSGYWISLAWLVEGVVITLIGASLRDRVIQIFGSVFVALGVLGAIGDAERIRRIHDVTPFFNMGAFLMLASSAALGVVAWTARRLYGENSTSGSSHFSFVLPLTLAFFVGTWAIAPEFGYLVDHLELLPWMILAPLLLWAGLYYRSRFLEVLGWFLAIITLFALGSELSQMRASVETGGIPFLNLGTFFLILATLTPLAFVFVYRGSEREGVIDIKKATGILLVLANIIFVMSFSSELAYVFDRQITRAQTEREDAQKELYSYYGNTRGNSSAENTLQSIRTETRSKVEKLTQQRDIAVSLFWIFYSILVTVMGFVRRSRELRLFGLAFFFITAIRIFGQIFSSMDELGRIIVSIVFGLFALGASFLYLRFKERIINE